MKQVVPERFALLRIMPANCKDSIYMSARINSSRLDFRPFYDHSAEMTEDRYQNLPF
jgi:hypothetical protein